MDSIEWKEMYLLAKAYYEIYDNLDIPLKFRTEKIKKLSKWLEEQKESYKNGILNEEEIKALEHLQINWEGKICNSHENRWNRIYLLAKKYYEVHGNLNIPTNYITEKEGIKLGIWIVNQRTNYKKGSLSDEKIQMLEQIGMEWSAVQNRGKWLSQKEDQWNRKYLLAQKYYEEHGDLNIPQSYITEKEGIKLGVWISHQRQVYKENLLSEERIQKLEKIGMEWSSINKKGFKVDEERWEEKYYLAKKYYEEHGDLNIPRDYKTDEGIKLGIWIFYQRQVYKNNKLSKERKEKLESIRMKWSAIDNRGKSLSQREAEWNRKYNLAKTYYEIHGNLNIPVNYITENEGIKLGVWISLQRQIYKKGNLSNDRIEKLERIGMTWDASNRNGFQPNELKWNEMYALALDYYEKYKNLDVPINYITEKEGIKLGIWVSNQRQVYKKNKLSKERIEKLEQIGMKWSALENKYQNLNEYKELKWNEMYALALEYYEEYGNLKIPRVYEPQEGIKLGKWIVNQRQAYKNNKLSEEKIKELESIGMIWSMRSNKNTKDNINVICAKYQIDYDANKDVLEHISLNELVSKIYFLNYKKIPIVIDGKLNEIFRMSNINLKMVYGCSLEEMMELYANSLLKSVNSKLKSAKRILSK